MSRIARPSKRVELGRVDRAGRSCVHADLLFGRSGGCRAWRQHRLGERHGGRAGLSKIGPFVPRGAARESRPGASPPRCRDQGIGDASPIHEPGPKPLHVSLVAIPGRGDLDAERHLRRDERLLRCCRRRPPAHARRRSPSRSSALEAGPLHAGQPRAGQRAASHRRRSTPPTSSSCRRSCSARTAGRRGGIPALVEWLRRHASAGALLCSACSGIFLLAETGLFDGTRCDGAFGPMPAPSRPPFRGVPIHPERVLVVSGEREELISSGASMTWHDLVLYLIGRYAGATRRPGGGAHASRCNGTRTGSRPSWCSRARRITATPPMPVGTGLDREALLGRQSARGDGEALRPCRAHLQAPLHQRRPA